MENEVASALSWNLLDNLKEGVIVVDDDGAVHYFNQAARTLLELKENVLSLAEIYREVAPGDEWQALLSPPAEMCLQAPNSGKLDVQSKLIHLDHNDFIQILVSPAVMSAELTEEPTAAIEQLTALTRISSEPNFDNKLQLIVDGLQATGWNRVVLTLRDPGFRPTKMITAGFSESERQFLRDHMLPPEAWQKLFNDSNFQLFRRGYCYFVPGDSHWSQEYFGMILPDPTAVAGHVDAWHPRDLLCVPLYDRQQRRIGLLGLDQPRNGRRPDTRTLQTIELYAQFAASVVENAQLVNETLARSRELQILSEASHALSGALVKDRVLTVMGTHMQRAVQADGYTIYQWKVESQSLLVLEERAQDVYPPLSPSGTVIEVGAGGLLQQVLDDQQPLSIHVEADDTTLLPRPPWLPKEEQFSNTLLPIVLSEEPFGLIQLFYRGKRELEPREIQLLAALANQTSKALETALIFEDTYERERFYNALGNVNLAINFTLDRPTLLNLICSESLRIFDVDGAYIWQIEREQLVGTAAKGHGTDGFLGTSVSLDDGEAFVAQIARNGEATFVNNVHQASEPYLKSPQREQVQAVLGIPLEQEGKISGVLVLADTQRAGRFSDKELTQAITYGVQVGIALQNAKLFEELRRFNEELDLRVAERTHALHDESNRVKILLRITTELSASLDQDRVLTQALQLVNEVVSANQGVILLIDQETGELIFRAAFGMGLTLSPRGMRSGLMRDEGLAGWIIENRSAVIVRDTNMDPRWVYRASSRDHRSVLGVPLISNEEVIGVLMLFHSEPNAFTMQQLDLVEAAAVQVASAINNANLYLLIRDQAERLGTMLRAEQIETAKNQAILESIADGVLVADDRSRIILANMPVSSILDIPREQLIGKSVNELMGMYGRSADSWIAAIENWAQNADRIERWTYLADEFSIEDKVVSVHLSPVLAGNQFFGTVSIFRDITREVEVDKLKSEFVSTVSHELRTPMTSIKGYADLMLMGAAGAMTPPQVRYLKVIKNNADRLHMLVNDLLNISRIETGKTALDLRPLDVSQVIEQVVEGHLRGRIQHEAKKLTVFTELKPSLPLVNADHARLTQILTNLLDNAFNYTPEGGEIRVGATAVDYYVRVSVCDTGIGISRENQYKIFDRFFRAEDEAVQRVPGTGLGLAIVRSLIEMHGGQLEVESKPGVGSTFTFNLPVVVEDSDLA